MENTLGTLLIKVQLEIDVVTLINVMDKELAVDMDGAKVLLDQPKMQTILTIRLLLEINVLI